MLYTPWLTGYRICIIPFALDTLDCVMLWSQLTAASSWSSSSNPHSLVFLAKKFGLMKREMPLEGKEVSSLLLKPEAGKWECYCIWWCRFLWLFCWNIKLMKGCMDQSFQQPGITLVIHGILHWDRNYSIAYTFLVLGDEKPCNSQTSGVQGTIGAQHPGFSVYKA